VNMIIDVAADLVEIALPERLEDHLVGGLGALEEAGDVERRIGGKDRTNAGSRSRNEGHIARIGGDRGGYGWLADARLDPPVGVGRLEDRLLLMPGALAEHAVEAQADKQSD